MLFKTFAIGAGLLSLAGAAHAQQGIKHSVPAAPTTAAVMPAGHVDAPAGVVPRGLNDCIFSDIPEGEPDCADGQTDAFNGGCNSTPNVFGQIYCGQTVCGTYGTFLSPGGTNFRDTDWYHFTLQTDASVTWTAIGDARTRIFILEGTCPSVSLGTASGDANTPVSLTLQLAAGTYSAFVATDAFTGVPCGSRYRATLTASVCCDVAPRFGDLIEQEPVCGDGYVDVSNGGCNSTPNVFSPMYAGQSVAGTYGTYTPPGGGSFRDTDWYQFFVTEPSTVTWTVVGEAATRVFILEGRCPAVSIATAGGAACTPVSVTTVLQPGVYYAFAGTDVFTGVPCGSRYRGTLTFESGCQGDFNRDGTLNSQDFFDFLNAFFAGCP